MNMSTHTSSPRQQLFLSIAFNLIMVLILLAPILLFHAPFDRLHHQRSGYFSLPKQQEVANFFDNSVLIVSRRLSPDDSENLKNYYKSRRQSILDAHAELDSWIRYLMKSVHQVEPDPEQVRQALNELGQTGGRLQKDMSERFSRLTQNNLADLSHFQVQ